MKKTLSLLLVLAMVLSSFGFAFAAKEEVKPAEFLNEKGILKGNASGDLMLEDNLKRQDMIVMLSRLLGEEEDAKAYEGETSFKDVVDPFYVPYVAWAEANELTNGKAEGKFGFDEFVTEQQVAQFMLRALGYGEVAWDDVPAKAAALKLVEKDADLTKDAKRSVLAEITYKALGTKMKDSEKTLAEFLGIEMPVVEVKELKVEDVRTENLREVVVELSNAKLVDKEKLEDVNNYKLVGYKVEKATVEDNNVIILLSEDKVLVKNKNYELIVRNIDKAVNGTHKFKAEDNTIPEVEKVEILGEYGIKVTTSEPVVRPLERNFLIDGKNIAMKVEQYGRDIILTPYHDKEFPAKAEKLTIKGLVDYAGYKTIEEDFEIEIVKDEVAPKVVDVIVKGNEVEVIFDKDIYADSVSGYFHGKATGNISYKDGRHTIYTKNEYYETGSDKKDTNKVVYFFEKELPRRAELTIEGVANHSNVEMEKVTTEGRIVQDYSEPEILKSELWDFSRGEKDGEATAIVRIHFDKEVEGIYINRDKKELGFNASEHFDLYEREVTSRNRLTNSTADYAKYVKSVKYVKDRKDVVEVSLENLNVNTLDKFYDYVLEVRNFTDTTSFRNKMYRDYVDFNIPRAGSAFKVTSVEIVKENDVETEIAIRFNKPVDREIAENPTNYLFEATWGTKYDVEELDGKIIVERDGKTVTLVLPEFKSQKADYKTLEVLQSIKDIYGGRLIKDNTIFDLTTGKIANPPAEDVEIANFKETHKVALALKVSEVKATEHKTMVDAALTAYGKLSDKAKAGLKDEKAHLDALESEINAQIEAVAPLTLASAKEVQKPVKAEPATAAEFNLTTESITLAVGDLLVVDGVQIEITDATFANNITLDITGALANKQISVDTVNSKFVRENGVNFDWKYTPKTGTEKTGTTSGKEEVKEVKQQVELVFNKDMSGVVKIDDIVTVNSSIAAKVISVDGNVIVIETTAAVAAATVIPSPITILKITSTLLGNDISITGSFTVDSVTTIS